ncbi:hypothetical protein MHYP_G00217470 [Metynnis hypsauchen]
MRHASQIKGEKEQDGEREDEKQRKDSSRVAQRERLKDGWAQENVCNLIRSDVELCEEMNEDVLGYTVREFPSATHALPHRLSLQAATCDPAELPLTPSLWLTGQDQQAQSES